METIITILGTVPVPDSGTTLLLLSVGIASLGAIARFIKSMKG